MSFFNFVWNGLEYVPVVGTFKNGAEAVAALRYGNLKEAACQGTKAVVGGVLDTCTFGAASTVGKVVVTGAMKAGANVAARYATNQVLPNSQISYAEVAVKSTKPTKTEGTEKEPSGRGEHVINNNVLRVYRDIVDEFVSDTMGESLQDMISSGRLSSDSAVFTAINQPLPPRIMAIIQDELKVYITEAYVDFNAETYGRQIEILRAAVVSYMQRIYDQLMYGGESGGFGGIPQLERNVRSVIENFIAGNYFVDEFALVEWLKKPGNTMDKFERAHKRVVKMFRRLIYDGDNDEVIQWVKELWEARQRR